MQKSNEQPMAIIIRNDDCAQAAEIYFATREYNCELNGHRLTFKSADLSETFIRKSIGNLACAVPEMKTTEICVEYLDDHTRDYILQ